MPKLGRNDQCSCGSKQKYKRCCLGKDALVRAKRRERLIYGDEYSSPMVKCVVQVLRKIYLDHEIIDVSGVLDEDTYRPLQTQHFNKNIIMLAERNSRNELVFATRCPPEHNLMVLYRGAFRCMVAETEVTSDVMDDYDMEGLQDMIDTRFAGKNYR